MIESADPLRIDDRSRVGESPIWDAAAGLIRWCDIDGGRILAADLQGRLRSQLVFEQPVAAIDLLEPGRLIVAFARSVEVLDLRTGRRDRLADVCLPTPTTRLNDGKLGPDGAFWIGSIDPREPAARTSRLHRVGLNGTVAVIQTGLGISNGLAWSPDARWLFNADTLEGVVWRRRLDPASGVAGPRAAFVSLDRSVGLPDGGACDADGAYWSAGVTAGRINVFGADGAFLRSLTTPVQAPTAVCFAPGHLVVTSLRRSSGAHALDGHTLIYRLDQALAPQSAQALAPDHEAT